MDELFAPPASFFPPSPPPQLSNVDGNHQFPELASCEVPQQWLLGDVVVPPKSEGSGYLWSGRSFLSPESELSELPSVGPLSPTMTPPTVVKRRGRKPRPQTERPTVGHVEAERQRRDKLNRRFCDLRAAVPTVSRMDKASLLADATNYIAELTARIARLEDESRQATAASRGGAAAPSSQYHDIAGGEEAVEVQTVMGREAAAALLRVTSVGGGAAQHAPARLMGALRSLELRVQHACVSRVQGVTVQDVVVDVPPALQQDDGGAALRTTLIQRLHDTS
ncbi:transcription factor bHLH14-like [Lolium rigidum]|uniref:transcription factor bHLH14-like n=1 Tax=Lolium rigidum TaxID=89674 RepID=UPI001F5D5A58|nr:transcription factor bHLH14-like [Lolium rigidum]